MTSTERTFVVNFRVIPARVKNQDIFDFMQHKLGFEFTQIRHLQITNGRVFVGTDSPQIAQDIVQEHNMKHQHEHEGKSYTIPISMEDGSIEVRIHDLRPRVTNKQLAQRMLEYGEVLSIREEVWKDFLPGVPNGVRIVRMTLRKAVSSYITVDNCMILVTYKGQVAACKHCNRNVHYTLKCSEYAKSIQVSVNSRLSMADVLKSGLPTERSNTQPSHFASSQLRKNTPHYRSNVSLASDISISSAEHMDTDHQKPETVGPSAKDTAGETSGFSGTAEISKVGSTASQNTTEAPSDNTGNNQAATQAKRPRSPQFVEPQNIEKRQSRTEIRTDRVNTRSKSRSRNH